MKKVIILSLILVVIIVLVIVISKNMKETTVTKNINLSINDLRPTKFSPERMNILEGISLVQLDYDNNANVIKFTLQNNSRDIIYYGEEIILEKCYKGKWYEIQYSGDIGFVDILNYLSPLHTSERSVPIGIWIPVTAGKYRIVYEVSTQEHFKNLYPISAEFTIDK